jgi:hypothetical protein
MITDRGAPVTRTRGDDDRRARESLADIVVRVAEHFQQQTLHTERAERLTCGAFKPDMQTPFRQ